MHLPQSKASVNQKMVQTINLTSILGIETSQKILPQNKKTTDLLNEIIWIHHTQKLKKIIHKKDSFHNKGHHWEHQGWQQEENYCKPRKGWQKHHRLSR